MDANRARELPAHNDPESASSQLDVSALARSLLAQVAASFGASSAASGSPLSAHDAVAAFSEGAKTAAQDAGASARLQAGLAAAPTPNDPSQPGVQSQPAIASNASVQTQPHADPAGLLARMLLRAAGVDARFNGAAIATALVAKGGAERAASRAPVGPGTPAESTASAGRLGAVLSETIAAASSGGGAASGDSFGDADASANASTVTAAKATTTTRADAIAFALPTASPSSALHGAAESGSLPTGTPVDPSAIVEQVVKGLSMRTLTDGTSEVRLRLVPEQLGAVSLHLTVDGSNVSATAVAQNADVRNALVAQQHHLARSLADAGLKLTGFTVNLSGGDAGNDRNRDRTSGFGRHYAVHEVTASGTDLTESSSAGPALLPESTLALFNYLA